MEDEKKTVNVSEAHGRVLKDLVQIMRLHLENLYKHEDELLKLQTASEARMDRTNDMVCKLAETTARTQREQERVLEKTTHYIDELIKSRNDLQEQNKMLLRLHEQDLNDKRMLHREIIENRDKIFEMIDKLVHATQSHAATVENKFYDK